MQKRKPKSNVQIYKTSAQIFALEKAAVENGTSIDLLMERAGTAVFEEIIKNYKPCKVLVLCGSGNNGGDGFVVARLLKEKSWNVTVTLDTSKDISSLSDAARINRAKWTGKMIDFKEINFDDYDLIIDALFGIGLHTNIREPYATIIKSINNKKIVSVDIPSGIDSDTGKILGCAIKAELTVTFEYKKPAFKLAHLKKYFGKVVVEKIGLD